MKRQSSTSFWTTCKSLTLFQLCQAIVFFLSGILITILQASVYLTVRPFSPTLYRQINYYLSYALNCQVVFVAEWWSGSDPQIFADASIVQRYFAKEHALVIMNHGCEVDWIMGWVVGERLGVLGNVKAYIKKVLQYAPVLGWTWKLQEFVCLERNWEKDRKTLPPQLSNLGDYIDPIWLCIWPEGTRFNKEKYEASMEVAKSKGMPLLKHHLLPRTKGFVSSIPHLKGKFKAIYDWIVVVDKDCANEPSTFSLLKGKEIKTVSMIRRIPIEEVPNDEEGAAQWLHKLFQDRDKLMDNYLTTGDFVPKDEKNKEEYQIYKGYEMFHLKRRLYTLFLYVFWILITLVPLANFVLRTFFTGSLLASASVLVVGALSYCGLHLLINLSQTSKGSSYGSRNSKRK